MMNLLFFKNYNSNYWRIKSKRNFNYYKKESNNKNLKGSSSIQWIFNKANNKNNQRKALKKDIALKWYHNEFSNIVFTVLIINSFNY